MRPGELQRLNSDLYNAEPRGGKRAAVLGKFGGLEKLAEAVKTDVEDGVPSAEVEARRTMYGANEMPKRKSKTLLSMIWERCKDTTIIVLALCAGVSLGLGLAFPEEFFDPDCQCVQVDSTGWVEGVAILVAVVLVVMVGAFQDHDKERKFRALGREDVRFIKVVRGGREEEVQTTQLVVGDLVVLELGKFVPADGVVVMSGELKVDEASMTGESEPTSKGAEDPLMLTNTSVIAGTGTMLVTAVGPNTEWGATLRRMQESPLEETPLQAQLGATVLAIGKVGLAVGVLTFLILGIYWFVDTLALVREDAWHGSYVRGIVDALIIGITLLVVGIPEGLPLAVIISLAYSMKAMTKDNILVRHLEACETMGGATNICSDKTGTLTQNKMTAVKGWIGGESFGAVPWGDGLRLDAEFWESFRVGIALNATAARQRGDEGAKVVGNPTEMALLDMVDAVDGATDYYVKLRKTWARRVVLQVPFCSETKRMTTIVEHGDVLRFFVKGAPDLLIAECDSVLMADNKLRDLPKDGRQELLGVVKSLTDEGFRALFLGYYDMPASSFRNGSGKGAGAKDRFGKIDLSSVKQSIVAMGIVGMEDPVRPEVPAAVGRCIQAGITVRMVTGDYPGTAVKIAEQCGIKTAKGTVMTGAQFREMSDEELDRAIPQLQVLARAQPNDKLRLVQRLRALNQIVAVTGDGTNDAAALKEADVGLAMGIMGTDVAKEASDIIVMDDNFRSIVSAVKWGRNVYESVRKFLGFQLTVNFAALVLVFVGAVSQYGAPLRAVQLLWINLIMDTLAALALATEPPTDLLLDQTPHGQEERMISNIMWKHIIGQAAYQLLALFLITYMGDLIPFASGHVVAKSRVHYTLVFNAFVWCQLFNELNARSIDDHQNVFRNIHRSIVFIAVMLLSIALQVCIVQFGSNAFKVAPLTWDQWLLCVGVGAASLPVGFVLRLIPVPKTHIADTLQFWNRHEKVGPAARREHSMAEVGVDGNERETEPLLSDEQERDGVLSKRVN